MNILDIQDKLKGLSESQLAQEMQMPTGSVPQFLVLGEMNRRQTMRQSMQQQGAGAQTVAQELLNGAGVPSEGMSEMGRSMAPKSSIAQNTGIGALPQQAPPPEQGGIVALAPTGMYAGGPVTKMAGGSQGVVSALPSWLTGTFSAGTLSHMIRPAGNLSMVRIAWLMDINLRWRKIRRQDSVKALLTREKPTL